MIVELFLMVKFLVQNIWEKNHVMPLLSHNRMHLTVIPEIGEKDGLDMMCIVSSNKFERDTIINVLRPLNFYCPLVLFHSCPHHAARSLCAREQTSVSYGGRACLQSVVFEPAALAIIHRS